ncbi:putative D-alanyl-D-alanine carboxypeptidase [Crocosphaera subtropica ATCC 51142]|uniref:D-alanyl-D-alanine carboxypeptidase n=1 Tax=Crocosphaera subtropica (strain ATCC 51142 / BH68) TaxID=43989 RepID=B1WQH0_CROS5|nr:D-alanyl-D-alanine carboxypeptidase [Crocosphaera subtropica]ACB51681.1 putative D-alanyl-D-alanine carboxypeptidase [Crocosphaera subtropica ATCC 51142]
MRLTRSWLPTLAIVATTSLTAISPSFGNNLKPLLNNPEPAPVADSPIEIYVPPPENNTSGSCAALITPVIDNIISPYEKHWGILVEKLDDGTVLYSHNADRHFIPASNNKIFTTAAALQLKTPQSKIGSKSLQSWVNVTNVRSNNYYADTLLRHIGGQQAAKSALGKLGVLPNTFRQVDGSGLSRRNVATPRSLVTILRAMYYTPNRDIFYSSLPVAGVTGTLRNRMKGTSAQGTVSAKTGTLRGVRALSGYMKHPHFGMVVFSILVNNPSVSGSAMIHSIDKIVLQLSSTRPCDS